MKLRSSSQHPTQLSLFPIKEASRRTHLRARLNSMLWQALVLFVFIAEYEKLRRIFATVAEIHEVGFAYSPLANEGHEFSWLILLALMLLVAYLFRERLPNTGRRLITVIAIGGALLIYLFELILATARFAYAPTFQSAPTSFYIIGGGLIILALWELPARQLAPWRDKLEVKDYLSILNSCRTILLQVIGGAIVISGLYYTAQNMSIAQENVRLTLLKEDTDRLNQAITQLKDENSEVRLVAIYNLQPFATKSLKNYELVSNLFSRYVRAHAPWKDGQEQTEPEDGSRDDLRSILSFLTNLDNKVTVIRTEEFFRSQHLTFSSEDEKDYAGIRLGRVNLPATDLRQIYLNNASMVGWWLTSAHLEKATLRSANLEYARLQDANLSGTDLKAAVLTSAKLNNAKLNGADLKDAILDNADLEGADFTDAVNLTADQVRRAINYDKAKLPPSVQSELGKVAR
jgi:uncharacterized protein YjbI with pentapeptide repeats